MIGELKGLIEQSESVLGVSLKAIDKDYVKGLKGGRFPLDSCNSQVELRFYSIDTQ